MPTELIGEVGTPGATREWIGAEAKRAIKHLCGEPPMEWSLRFSGKSMSLAVIPPSC